MSEQKSQEFAPSWCVDFAYQVWNSHSVVDVAEALLAAYKRGLMDAEQVAERHRKSLWRDELRRSAHDVAALISNELRRKAEGIVE